MTTLFLDKDTEKERSLVIDSFYEAPMKHHLNTSRKIAVESGTVYPDLSRFQLDSEVSSVTIISEGNEIPLVNEYNKITDISVNFSDTEKTYFVNLALGYATQDEAR